MRFNQWQLMISLNVISSSAEEAREGKRGKGGACGRWVGESKTPVDD